MAVVPPIRIQAQTVHDGKDTDVLASRKIWCVPRSALPSLPLVKPRFELLVLLRPKVEPPRTRASPSNGRYATSDVSDTPHEPATGMLPPLDPPLLLLVPPDEEEGAGEAP